MILTPEICTIKIYHACFWTFTQTHTHTCVYVLIINQDTKTPVLNCHFQSIILELQLLRGYKCRTHGKVQGCNLSRKTNVPEEKSGCPGNFRENFLKEVVPMLKGKEFNTVWRRGRWPAQSWGGRTQGSNMADVTKGDLSKAQKILGLVRTLLAYRE